MSVVRETVDAGVEQTRRQIQMHRLRRDVGQKEKEIAAAVARLGQRAWEHRVEGPAYAKPYAQLMTRSEQQESLRQQIVGLEQEVDAELAARDATDAEWTAKLEIIAAERTPVTEELANLETAGKSAAERLHVAERELERTQKEHQAIQTRLAELEHLTAVDVDQRRTRFLSRTAGLEQAIAALEAQLPDLHSAVEENAAAQPPLQARLIELDEQATRTRAQKGAAVAAHEIRLADLRELVKEVTAQIAALANEITQISAEMGPAVDKARPDTEALREEYAAIDALESERIELLAELADLKVESEAADITAVRRFYVVITGLVVFVVLVLACLATMCLTVWVFVGAAGGG
jgi:chromosome segregation ATPase